MDTPDKEEIIIDEFFKLAQEYVAEVRRTNDLRALELELQLNMELAQMQDHSVEFEYVEMLMERIRQCGK